ncbi:hypothetical protein [Clostridium sp. BSD9I1]|uniref:hypothetical protein n=1 Tax=Clostridium sp. BSD9I1 TaxID=2003589 RepID=UPI0016488698|nr:hypothetical protein [Clostridium sp. BSD9I1]
MNKRYVREFDPIFDVLEEKARNHELVDKQTVRVLNFEVIKRREKRFKEKRKCIINGCSKESIKKSHSIQKSKSLKLISEENHLLQPLFKETGDKVEMHMDRVGIKDASTFPGYCSDHEKRFEEFEITGKISTIYHGQLQSYRTICR